MALLRIEANPEDEGVQLLGSLAGKWRKGVGGYRIVYKIREEGRSVIVETLRKRGEGY